ncbi:TPA: hypothetical protein ACQUHP_007027, partial [Bacillus cereus]
SIKDNKKLHGKISLCININFKLMDVGEHHITIKLILSYPPKLKFSFSTYSYSEKPLIFFVLGAFLFLKLTGMYGAPY